MLLHLYGIHAIERQYCNSNGLQIRIINKEVSRKLNVENAQQSLAVASNARKELLVLAHTRSPEKSETIN